MGKVAGMSYLAREHARWRITRGGERKSLRRIHVNGNGTSSKPLNEPTKGSVDTAKNEIAGDQVIP